MALGKAHAVLLTKDGGVYTFGINNKGQCGRFSNLSRKYSAKQAKLSKYPDRVKEPMNDHLKIYSVLKPYIRHKLNYFGYF